MKQSWINITLLLGVSALLVSMVILSAVPPVSKDALTHHLAVPKLYVKQGGMVEISSMLASYYPMNLDLLYVIPLWLGHDIIPKYIHLTFALLTAWMLYVYLRSRLNRRYALFGGLLFLSIPIVFKLSITAYVDLGLVFFSTASLMLLLEWAESGFRVRYLLLSGIACGLAMGTKYNGLITFVLMTLSVPAVYAMAQSRKEGVTSKAVGFCLVFVLLSLLLFSPWMVRNYVWTGNPLFPLYDGWFNPSAGDVMEWQGVFVWRNVLYQEPWWKTVLVPLRIFFQGQDGNPQYFDGRLTPLLLILPLFNLWRAGDETPATRMEKRALAGFACLFIVFAMFGKDMRIRYVAAALPPLVILSALGLRNLFHISSHLPKGFSRYARGLMGCGVAVTLLWSSGWYIREQFRQVRPLDYLQGNMSRDQYIQHYRKEYRAMKYINENLPADARVLFFFIGNRGYYCDREYLFDMRGDRSLFQQIVRDAENSGMIFQGMEQLGVSHVLIHQRLFEQWIGENFNQGEKIRVTDFFNKHVQFLFAHSGYKIGKIHGEEA